MRLSSQLMTLLASCIEATYNPNSFDTFTILNRDDLKVTFKTNTVDCAYPDRIVQYLQELEKHNTLFCFIEFYIVSRSNHDAVKKFKEEFESYFKKTGNKWEIAIESFDYSLLKERLPFIDRDSVKKALHKMVNNKTKLIVLNGKPRSGLTYVKWYLSELAENSNYFDFEPIDLRDELKCIYQNEQVNSVHIAKRISGKLEIQFSTDPNGNELFKTQPFINNNLRPALRKLNRTCLFFIDQFDVPLADDVSEFLQGLAKLIYENNYNCCFVLSGYQGLNSWDRDLRRLVTFIDWDYGSFDRAHVNIFLSKLYKHLSEISTVDLSEKDFIETSMTLIPDELFEMNDKPNVTEIGDKFSDWLCSIIN